MPAPLSSLHPAIDGLDSKHSFHHLARLRRELLQIRDCLSDVFRGLVAYLKLSLFHLSYIRGVGDRVTKPLPQRINCRLRSLHMHRIHIAANVAQVPAFEYCALIRRDGLSIE